MSALLNPSAAWDTLFNDLSDSEALRLLAAWTPPADEDATTASAPPATNDTEEPAPFDEPEDEVAGDIAPKAPEPTGGQDTPPPAGDIAQPPGFYATDENGFLIYGGLSLTSINAQPGPAPKDVPDVVGDDPPPAQVGTNAGWML